MMDCVRVSQGTATPAESAHIVKLHITPVKSKYTSDRSLSEQIDIAIKLITLHNKINLGLVVYVQEIYHA